MKTATVESFIAGLVVGIGVSVAVLTAVAFLGTGASGVGTEPDPIHIEVSNRRLSAATIELVHGGSGLVASVPDRDGTDRFFALPPGATATFTGVTHDHYESAWFRFAASEQYDSASVVTQRDQPTSMVEFHGGSWTIELLDDTNGSFFVRIESLDRVKP